jgi:hypothetical protein
MEQLARRMAEKREERRNALFASSLPTISLIAPPAEQHYLSFYLYFSVTSFTVIDQSKGV